MWPYKNASLAVRLTDGMLKRSMGHKTPSVRPTPSLESVGSGRMPRAASSSPFVDRLARRLANLCDATGLSRESSRLADQVFRELIVPWSRVEAFAQNPGSSWTSEISDDNTPIEFSVTLSPMGSEVRVL